MLSASRILCVDWERGLTSIDVDHEISAQMSQEAYEIEYDLLAASLEHNYWEKERTKIMEESMMSAHIMHSDIQNIDAATSLMDQKDRAVVLSVSRQEKCRQNTFNRHRHHNLNLVVLTAQA